MSRFDDTDKLHSMAELLPWMFLGDEDNSIVVNKDSSLMASWILNGVDIESGDSFALEDAAGEFDAAIRRIARYPVTIWTRVDREPVDEYIAGTFTNDMAQYIDDEWGKQFAAGTMFLNRQSISIAMATGAAATSIGEAVRANIDNGQSFGKAIVQAVKSRFSRGEQRFGFGTRDELEYTMRRFEQAVCQTFTNGMTKIRMERLTSAQLQGFLKSTASPNALAEVEVSPSEYLDSYLSDSFINNQYADYLVLDGLKKQFVGVFTLKAAPGANMMQKLDPLLAKPLRLSIATCWKAYSSKEAQSFLSNARTWDEMRHIQVRQLFKAAIAQESAIDADDTPTSETGWASKKLKDAEKDNNAFFGALAVSVMVYADSPRQLELNMTAVGEELARAKLEFIRERDGSLSAFCVGIPGQLREPVRWHFVEACSATDLAPLISLESGDPYHPFFSEDQPAPLPPNATFKTRWNSVQYFNYHDGQVGHTLIIGPTFNGKTMFQLFLEAQHLKYPNARIINFDKDQGCRPFTRLFDGAHFDLSPGAGGLPVNPMTMLTTPAGKTWLTGWIERLLTLRGDPLTDQDITDIDSGLDRLVGVPRVRLSTLMNQIPPRLKLRLAPWCEGGPWGEFFDHYEDHFELSTITTFEIGGLLAAKLYDVLTAFSDYAFYRIERLLNEISPEALGPTMIYFEEAGFLLQNEHASRIFSDQAGDYLMTLRKKKAQLIMTAQSPEPFVKNETLKANIRDNISTIILLPNPAATRPNLAPEYKAAFSLTDNHLELVATAIPKAEYCIYKQRTGEFRVIRAKFPKSIIAALSGDKRYQAFSNQLYNPGDPSWKQRYLAAVSNT